LLGFDKPEITPTVIPTKLATPPALVSAISEWLPAPHDRQAVFCDQKEAVRMLSGCSLFSLRGSYFF
jgi:hypothetical protein